MSSSEVDLKLIIWIPGIGFITPDGEEEGENDILVHYEQIKQETEDGFKSLQAGSKVEYELAEDPKNADKQIAVKVTGPEGADCEYASLETLLVH